MKKQYTVVLLLLIMSLVSPVFAEDGTSGSSASTTPGQVRVKEIRDRLEQRREELKDRIKDRKASTTERRIEVRKAVAKNRVANVTRLMLATIDRLEKIIVRIESKIEKIKGEGGSTAEAESFVALAKENLADAKVAVDTFSALDLSGSTDTVRENSDTIRAAAAEAKADLRDARSNLVEAVKALKGQSSSAGEKNETSNASTTSGE